MSAQVIDFQTEKEIREWTKYLDKIKEICFSLNLPANPQLINEIVLHHLYWCETNIDKQAEIQSRLTIPISDPGMMHIVGLLNK